MNPKEQAQNFQSNIKTHDSLESQPEILNIILGSDCNLTCSYCDKQYSMAWLRDIKDHGSYLDTPRFKLTPVDLIKSKVSQKEEVVFAIAIRILFRSRGLRSNLEEIEGSPANCG